MTAESGWQRRKILIWGKTRPEISQKYREIVCTGGLFEDTKRLVRLYPIPLRYLNDEQFFRKYQWIEADVRRAEDDRRPESYRIRADNIALFDTIEAKRTWAERAAWLLQPHNIYRSVEALQAQQAVDHTSLGLVRPKTVVQVKAEPLLKHDKQGYWNRYNRVLAQQVLNFADDMPTVKPLTPPDYRFVVRFKCDDPACALVHNFSVLDWEVDALYFNLHTSKGDPPAIAAEKVRVQIETRCGPKHDTMFFLGNISNYPHIFTIVGFWSPVRNMQGSLLADLDA